MRTDCILSTRHVTLPRVAVLLPAYCCGHEPLSGFQCSSCATVCLGALHIERSIEGECFCFSYVGEAHLDKVLFLHKALLFEGFLFCPQVALGAPPGHGMESSSTCGTRKSQC